MPLVRLIAEGVGPFERLDLDFSDGNGKPHLGPHILAGINGSGKSTVLRTIAWLMEDGGHGFGLDDWLYSLKGYARSRALVTLRSEEFKPYAFACAKGDSDPADFSEWVGLALRDCGIGDGAPVPPGLVAQHLFGNMKRWRYQGAGIVEREGEWLNVAAYSPSPVLKRIRNNVGLPPLPNERFLSFDKTVQNESVQSWLISLDYGRAKAKESGQSSDKYEQKISRLEAALSEVYGENVSFRFELEPDPEPRLRIRGQSLNFSQLPDGIKATVGWIADYMMRQDHIQWDQRLKGKRPGLLLLDEVDAHLHPLWQRLLLPAMRKALPDVQIVVTSHSPFVISSCPGARVHVLKVDAAGRASARQPVDSPIGESVTTTLKEIFGVDSRFDVLTERQLNEWNELKKREVVRSLSTKDAQLLQELTATLSNRSEELRSIVASPLTIPKTVLKGLLGNERTKRAAKRLRKVARH